MVSAHVHSCCATGKCERFLKMKWCNSFAKMVFYTYDYPVTLVTTFSAVCSQLSTNKLFSYFIHSERYVTVFPGGPVCIFPGDRPSTPWLSPLVYLAYFLSSSHPTPPLFWDRVFALNSPWSVDGLSSQVLGLQTCVTMFVWVTLPCCWAWRIVCRL